jgi:hypothetical protein
MLNEISPENNFIGFYENNICLTFSKHAKARSSQRGVKLNDIDYALLCGEKIYKQGLVFHVVQNKFLEKNSTAKNLVVITSYDGAIITAYKNPRAIKDIKKKHKQNLKFKIELPGGIVRIH